VIEQQDLATTSSKPRYALEKEFARLFDSSLRDKALLTEIESWQERHLSAAALARIRLKKRGFDDSESDKYVLIKLPNGEVRQMAPGPSSVLSKNVIEIFAHRYLNKPALLFLSESGNKIIEQDNKLALSLNLKIEIEKNLPDIILVDIEPQEALLVFVEVVVTDGAITSDRYKSLLKIALSAGFNEKNVVFVTAFSDRGDSAFRRLSSDIAWNSIIWFATEPEHLIIRTSESEKKITHILDLF
jgi:hypothetical protein